MGAFPGGPLAPDTNAMYCAPLPSALVAHCMSGATAASCWFIGNMSSESTGPGLLHTVNNMGALAPVPFCSADAVLHTIGRYMLGWSPCSRMPAQGTTLLLFNAWLKFCTMVNMSFNCRVARTLLYGTWFWMPAYVRPGEAWTAVPGPGSTVPLIVSGNCAGSNAHGQGHGFGEHFACVDDVSAAVQPG